MSRYPQPTSLGRGGRTEAESGRARGFRSLSFPPQSKAPVRRSHSGPPDLGASVSVVVPTHNDDFRRVWFSQQAEEFRAWMRERRCACPMANAAYTNMLVEPAAVVRVGTNTIRAPRGSSVRLEPA